MSITNNGPLAGLTVVELAGIGPGPYAATLLADMGARVIRIDRVGEQPSAIDPASDMLRRNRESIALNVRDPRGVEVVKKLIETADVFMEGFRPGVAERLGVGPHDLLAVNPRLVYGRMTGWGQTGPLAQSAGHDIDYIAITGALGAIGEAGGAPIPPLNFVGDFGGGSLFLVMGILAAVWEANRSGQGQIVDAAIVDGTTSFTGFLHSLLASGAWVDQRGSNLLDGGLPWYRTYQTADDRWMAVGALEPQFYATFIELLGVSAEDGDRRQRSRWPQLRELFAQKFVERTQAQWTQVFDGSDACVAPVLSLSEASTHPHTVERGGFVQVGDSLQPAPAPRFSRTPNQVPAPPAAPGAQTLALLREFGVENTDVLVGASIVSAPNVSMS